jgi:Zn-dependent protease
VFLLEPERTPYDLHFRVFGVSVRVHPMFWLFSALLGWGYAREQPILLIFWVLCSFVSILIHELGHVFMGRLFGRDSYVVLYSFGGLAIGSNAERYRWQRILVSFAGPAAGFVLLGVVLLFYLFAVPRIDPARQMVLLDHIVEMLIFMNLVWGLLNLVPIWPLDGGQISREVFLGLSPRNGLRHSLGLSLLVAALLAVHCFTAVSGRPLIPFLPFGGIYAGIFFALFAFQSFQLMQQADRGPW